MTAQSGVEHWIGRLTRSGSGYLLLADDATYRLEGAPDLRGLEETEVIVRGRAGDGRIAVEDVTETMDAKQLAEAALFLVRTRGRGALDHAKLRLGQASGRGDVRGTAIWTAIVREISGVRLKALDF